MHVFKGTPNKASQCQSNIAKFGEILRKAKEIIFFAVHRKKRLNSLYNLSFFYSSRNDSHDRLFLWSCPACIDNYAIMLLACFFCDRLSHKAQIKWLISLVHTVSHAIYFSYLFIFFPGQQAVGEAQSVSLSKRHFLAKCLFARKKEQKRKGKRENEREKTHSR